MSKANLDLNDELVKKGLGVSWHGYRGTVRKVRMGRCLVEFPSKAHVMMVDQRWLDCSSIQVIKA